MVHPQMQKGWTGSGRHLLYFMFINKENDFMKYQFARIRDSVLYVLVQNYP